MWSRQPSALRSFGTGDGWLSLRAGTLLPDGVGWQGPCCSIWWEHQDVFFACFVYLYSLSAIVVYGWHILLARALQHSRAGRPVCTAEQQGLCNAAGLDDKSAPQHDRAWSRWTSMLESRQA